MQTVTELPKRAQVAFLMHVVERLAEQLKYYSKATRLSKEELAAEPEIMISSRRIEWRFRYNDFLWATDQINKEFEDETEVELVIAMDLRESWLAGASSSDPETKSTPDLLVDCFAALGKPLVRAALTLNQPFVARTICRQLITCTACSRDQVCRRPSNGWNRTRWIPLASAIKLPTNLRPAWSVTPFLWLTVIASVAIEKTIFWDLRRGSPELQALCKKRHQGQVECWTRGR